MGRDCKKNGRAVGATTAEGSVGGQQLKALCLVGGQQLKALCLETEQEKRKKEMVSLSVSVPLVKGDRVKTGLGGLQGG